MTLEGCSSLRREGQAFVAHAHRSLGVNCVGQEVAPWLRRLLWLNILEGAAS